MDLNLSERQEWMFENSKMKTAKSLVFILAPALMIMFLFFLNVIHLNPKTGQLEKGHVSSIKHTLDNVYGNYWYSEILPKRHSRAIAMKR